MKNFKEALAELERIKKLNPELFENEKSGYRIQSPWVYPDRKEPKAFKSQFDLDFQPVRVILNGNR